MSRLRGAIFLVAAAMAAAALLAWMDAVTSARIANNELELRLAALRSVLPADAYDNEPHLDTILVTDEALLGDAKPLPVYRARLEAEPAAVVLTAVAPNGYTGDIRLLIGIDIDGYVLAARVVEHRETPGVGDAIETEKSDWILGFSGLQSENPLAPEWVLDEDGGDFDGITGATVTSHAVVSAVRNAVVYFNANREPLLAAPPTTASPD